MDFPGPQLPPGAEKHDPGVSLAQADTAAYVPGIQDTIQQEHSTVGKRRPAGRFLIFSRTLSAAALAACALLFFLCRETLGLPALLAGELAASAAVCVLHCADKIAAAAGAWRVPEKLLLALTMLSGGPAPWVTRQAIRHKTAREHRYFSVCEAAALTIHAALWLMPGLIPLFQ